MPNNSSPKHTGAMIALIPSDADLDRLVLDGGEPREELHLTLLYLGEATDIPDDAQKKIVARLEGLVDGAIRPDYELPVQAEAFAINVFNPHTDEQDTAIVLGINGQDLDTVHGMVADTVREVESEPAGFTTPDQHVPWVAHVTLAYSDDLSLIEIAREKLGPVIFDRIRVAFADEINDIALTTRRDTITSDAGGGTVPWHKVENHSDCSSDKPWAVVKDSSGEVEGCHASEDGADAQLAALYASESDSKSHASASDDCVDCDHTADHFGSSNSVSNEPWNGAASNFTDEQYKMSSAGCDPGGGSVKERCFLPHHNPGGALNKSGLSSAAGRANQLSGRSPAAVSRAKAHLRGHYNAIGEDVPDNLKATAEELAFTNAITDCPPGHHQMPDGECMPDEEMATTGAEWEGVITVEGSPTGDGREFAPESLTWAELPIPLRWNKEDSHGGIPQTKAVLVGNIGEVWREENLIKGRGIFDLGSEDGREAHRLVSEKFLKGISVDVDDVSDADIELVFPEDSDSGDSPVLDELFLTPEKILFHAGRIRAATLCDIPAFIEAYINVENVDAEIVASGMLSEHVNDTIDSPWELTEHESRLPDSMSVAKAHSAFAWVNMDSARDEAVAKTSGKFLHHVVYETGEVGAANLTACSGVIGALNSGKHTDLSMSARKLVYNHLAKHLRDAGKEVPAANFDEDTLVASIEPDDRPPASWFENPKLSVPTGITITDQGRVYGHAAEWGTCHVGVPGACVTPPEEDEHPYFMTGEVVCADGSCVAVGQITVGTGHAPLSYGASRATDHYDNTGAAVADVVVGNDKHGIWVAGAIRPHADVARIRDLRASGQVSGDWRRIGGQLRMVGLLAVNVPGFPVPKLKTRVALGDPQALVAAGRTSVGRPMVTEEELNKIAMRAMADSIAKRIGRDRHNAPAEVGSE